MLAKCDGFRDVRHNQGVVNGRTVRSGEGIKLVDVGC